MHIEPGPIPTLMISTPNFNKNLAASGVAILPAHNAVFLSYFEDARVALFDRWKIQPSGKSIIVAKVVANYYLQLLHPTDFIIGQKVSRVGNTSFDIQSTLFDARDKAVADAVITCVCFDFDKQKSHPVYELIKKDFNKS